MNGAPVGDIVADVRDYLDRTAAAFRPGSDQFYARIALCVALNAYRKGNFGIGAVAVIRVGNRAELFYGENGMGQPNAVIDHAETRAVLRVAAGAAADETIALPARAGPTGPGDPDAFDVAVHGTIEPCPMCACVLTNAGVRRSVSTCRDGAVQRDGDYLASSGAANVLGEKYRIQPRVWRDIQRARGLRFELLAPVDAEIHDLSWNLMARTRDELDRALAARPPIGSRRPGCR